MVFLVAGRTTGACSRHPFLPMSWHCRRSSPWPCGRMLFDQTDRSLCVVTRGGSPSQDHPPRPRLRRAQKSVGQPPICGRPSSDSGFKLAQDVVHCNFADPNAVSHTTFSFLWFLGNHECESLLGPDATPPLGSNFLYGKSTSACNARRAGPAGHAVRSFSGLGHALPTTSTSVAEPSKSRISRHRWLDTSMSAGSPLKTDCRLMCHV